MGLADARKADMVKGYIDWAMKNNFAVIDVNMPKHITQDISVRLFDAALSFRAGNNRAPGTC